MSLPTLAEFQSLKLFPGKFPRKKKTENRAKQQPLPEVEGEEGGRGCLSWVVDGNAEDEERKCLPASIGLTRDGYICINITTIVYKNETVCHIFSVACRIWLSYLFFSR